MLASNAPPDSETMLAITLAVTEQPARAARMKAARDVFADGLPPNARWVTPRDNSLPNTLMCVFEDVDGRLLLPALDMAGVEASQGSACSSGSPTPPAVLYAMGMDERSARACVRFSFAHDTSVEEAVHGAALVRDVVARLLDR